MFELACCESTMLTELTWKETTQKSLALSYALASVSSERSRIDWKKVNEAIITRWSWAGLQRVKKLAWKHRKEMAKQPA